jgi:structural maintenance of chromosome 1
LEGTIIHKSGLITGGRSTHNSSKKWDENDVQGEHYHRVTRTSLSSLTVSLGLIRVRDNLQSQRLELSKQKPRAKTDENLVSEVSRLESAITLARDDLVCLVSLGGCHLLIPSFGKAACKSRLSGLKEELKHIDKELKSNTPELKKVTNSTLLS